MKDVRHQKKAMRKQYCALVLLLLASYVLLSGDAHARASVDQPIVKLRSLDKITARTQVFEARVGSTIKFGKAYIRVQACRKAPELEQPESAAFLQVWEAVPAPEGGTTSQGDDPKSEWIFSGWMFSSSPGLSAMDHPIYDVWVLDCLDPEAEKAAAAQEAAAAAAEENTDELREDEGVLEEHETPEKPVIENESYD